MSTTIAKSRRYADTDHIILFVKEGQSCKSPLLSEQEREYVNKRLESKTEIPAVNQYDRWIFVQSISSKQSSKDRLLEYMRRQGSMTTSLLNKRKISSIYLVDTSHSQEVLAYAEGIALSNYQFLKYKSDKKKNSLNDIQIVNGSVDKKVVDRLQVSVDATCYARDLVNEPLMYLTATKMAETFKERSKEAGYGIEIFNKKKIESLKMGGLIAVNLGSPDPPTFSIMEWKPKRSKNKKPIVLVGKGVVYDTGGLSLKPTANSMDFMKCDMGGAAVVAGAMYAIAKAKLPVHVIALVPATDNRPGQNAYVPGDVITMYSGKTVEVLNTDAEGRMILADALHYAKQYDPELVMEFSTLTGAAAAAIGPQGIVCMGTASSAVKKKLKQCGHKVHERLADFPFWDEYDDLLKSDIADIKNIGQGYGGAITAGKFLDNFTDYPYMHFDIAGPAFGKSKDGYRSKNGTGVGVRLMFEYFCQLSTK
ncbi:MAG: leucyl aminopeptidase [Bacteroidia bacterium]|nr:leucyl aminopeptidase [Bacteroidia bacterium]